MKKIEGKICYRCTAEHYKGDKPHYWLDDGDPAWVKYYHPRRANMSTCDKKTCADHKPPTFLTADILADSITIDHFTCSTRIEKWTGMPDSSVFTLVGDGITIEAKFHLPVEWDTDKKVYNLIKLKNLRHSECQAVGHTSFTTDKGTRTFDRTGVEDSFYINYNDDIAAVQAKLEGQIKKVAESRERIKGMINIPGIPFLTSPEGKSQITTLLRAGKSHSFTPSGFGTGYQIYSRKAPFDRYDGRAKPETEAFFEVSPLWVRQLDCD